MTGSPDPHRDLTLDVERWVRGWAVSRGVAWHHRHGSWLIEVNDAFRSVEAVTTAESPDPHLMAGLAAMPRTWLTAIGPLAAQPDNGPVGWHPIDRDVEWFMTAVLAPVTPPLAPPGYSFTLTERSDVIAVEVHPAPRPTDDDPVARVQVGLAGQIAAADRVRTDPAHQRRGLASTAMRLALATAYDRGARHGYLIASPEGWRLYESLGWQRWAPVRTFSCATP